MAHPFSPLTEVRTFPEVDTLTREAAELWVRCAEEAVRARGRFSVCLSGGSTPQQLYARMATPAYRDRVPWARSWVVFGDERHVPPDHGESNFRMAHEALLAHVPVPAEQVLRMEGERDAREAAERYQALLRAKLGAAPLDLVWMGLGPDGHTASLFPGTTSLRATSDVTDVWVEKLKTHRITLTYPVFNAARTVAFLVAGAAKAEATAAVLQGAQDVERLPAQGVRPLSGELRWLLDAEAAARLRP